MWEAVALGHFLGDYVFQDRKMAVEKSKSTAVCINHCILYTTAIFVPITIFYNSLATPLFAFIIFISHYFIDRCSVAKRFMMWRDGTPPTDLFLYATVDNTLHFLLLFILLNISGVIC